MKQALKDVSEWTEKRCEKATNNWTHGCFDRLCGARDIEEQARGIVWEQTLLLEKGLVKE